ncbi:MAG TPA: TetR/AcrR family transcriptional regulator, partial [Iamia sp.]
MTNRSARTAATRRRIAEAAAALFMEHPFAEVTLAGIAEAAGVSHQTVLNHFESKEGVARAAAESFGGETIEARDSAPV